MRTDCFRDGNRAMCTACAANRYDHAMFSFILIIWNQKIQHIGYFCHKSSCHFIVHDKVPDIFIHSAMPAQFRNIKGIRQKTHIKNQVSRLGKAAFESEGHHLNPHRLRTFYSPDGNDLFQLFLKSPEFQVRCINQVICGFPKRLQNIAFFPYGLRKGHAIICQRMFTAGFLIT